MDNMFALTPEQARQAGLNLQSAGLARPPMGMMPPGYTIPGGAGVPVAEEQPMAAQEPAPEQVMGQFGGVKGLAAMIGALGSLAGTIYGMTQGGRPRDRIGIRGPGSNLFR